MVGDIFPLFSREKKIIGLGCDRSGVWSLFAVVCVGRSNLLSKALYRFGWQRTLDSALDGLLWFGNLGEGMI